MSPTASTTISLGAMSSMTATITSVTVGPHLKGKILRVELNMTLEQHSYESITRSMSVGRAMAKATKVEREIKIFISDGRDTSRSQLKSKCDLSLNFPSLYTDFSSGENQL